MTHIEHDTCTQYTLETLTTRSAGLLVTGLVKQYVGLLLGVLPERQNVYQSLISHNDSNTIPGRQVMRIEKNINLQKCFDFMHA